MVDVHHNPYQREWWLIQPAIYGLESDGQMRPCCNFGICRLIKCLIVIDELIGGVQSLVWEGDDVS